MVWQTSRLIVGFFSNPLLRRCWLGNPNQSSLRIDDCSYSPSGRKVAFLLHLRAVRTTFSASSPVLLPDWSVCSSIKFTPLILPVIAFLADPLKLAVFSFLHIRAKRPIPPQFRHFSVLALHRDKWF